MAYIGKSPSTKFSAAAKVDTFTGDGSTTTFDLANIIPAGGENGLQVFVDNVRQKPGSSNAFTVGNDGSGDLKRITFTAAPDASAEIYVVTTFEATNVKEVADGTISTAKLATDAITGAKLADDAVNSEHLTDGSVDNVHLAGSIADSKLSTITTASKVNVSSLSAPGSASVFLKGDRTYGAICTAQIDTNAFNISLLGFKMAVNEGLTVFNLVDGVVDEFHDESGTDEGEGSNDLYCASSDYYINSTSPDGQNIAGFSAGFTTTAVTEADTSTAGTNPGTGAGTFGQFTVPSGGTRADIYAWGASGSTEAEPGSPEYSGGGGGGFSYGTLAVTGEQVISVVVGESDPGVGGGGLGGGGNSCGEGGSSTGGGGGGLSGAFVAPVTSEPGLSTAPQAYIVAGAGGGSGHRSGDAPQTPAGAGGGLSGNAGGSQSEGQAPQGGPGTVPLQVGGGGTQTAGGQADPNASPASQAGSLFNGGNAGGGNGSPDTNTGGGGSGYYGGGGGAGPTPSNNPYDMRSGGGGSSYYGHPQITSGGTEEATNCESGGAASPYYVADTGEGTDSPQSAGPQVGGENGYVLIRSDAVCASATSTVITSNAFAAGSVPTTSRIVVFEENVATPTLNTDIIASISRDGGSNFTTATLTDSGYVTGASGQRILTGQATISGQPSGQSMRWKLALANNSVKIHGVSLQWA